MAKANNLKKGGEGEEKKVPRNFSRKNIPDLVEDLLQKINPRAKNILISRYGLKNNAPKSLSAIGRKLGITRERVRQIEADSFKKLKEASKSNGFQSLIDNAVKIIEKKGGFCEKSTLKEELIKDPTQRERNQLIFLLNSSADLHYKKSTLRLRGFWYKEKAFKVENIILIHGELVKFFNKTKTAAGFDEIWKYIHETSWGSFFDIPEGKERLGMILKLSKQIDKNLLGEWGLANWREIAERGSREKAFLVLRKHKKPMHFRKIADNINVYWTGKKSLPQTVHNELIKDGRFVLVGRGTYGLSDWGLQAGTVREVIIQCLEKKGGAAHRDEIVTYVLDLKKVKEATVLVNLANQSYFEKDERGNFFIRKK